MAIKVGDTLPAATFMTSTAEGPAPITTDDIFKGKTVVLFALPGAFTPTCSSTHLPGFLEHRDDILAQGAEPLFFLDYFATGKLEPGVAAKVVSGVAEGCRQAGCALVGGETAEMPGMYGPKHYDMAGFAVGAVERDEVLPRLDDMKAGDVLIALPSSGPHSNGYSLVRKIVERSGLAWTDAAPFAEGVDLGDALLAPTRIYVKTMLPLIRAGKIKGLAHITGGGITENTPRMLPDHLSPKIDRAAWELPPVFAWMQEIGAIEDAEMLRTFNCGVGMIVSVAPDDVMDVLAGLTEAGEAAFVIGEVEAR